MFDRNLSGRDRTEPTILLSHANKSPISSALFIVVICVTLEIIYISKKLVS